MFEESYVVTPEDLAPFGDHAVAKVGYVIHPKIPMLIACYDAKCDGHDVEVYISAAPARFYTIKALDGDPIKDFTLSTGSGMGKLAATIAESISDGMLGLEL